MRNERAVLADALLAEEQRAAVGDQVADEHERDEQHEHDHADQAEPDVERAA